MFILYMFCGLCFKMGQFRVIIPSPETLVDQTKARLYLPLETTSFPYLASTVPSSHFLEKHSLSKSSAPKPCLRLCFREGSSLMWRISWVSRLKRSYHSNGIQEQNSFKHILVKWLNSKEKNKISQIINE